MLTQSFCIGPLYLSDAFVLMCQGAAEEANGTGGDPGAVSEGVPLVPMVMTLWPAQHQALLRSAHGA